MPDIILNFFQTALSTCSMALLLYYLLGYSLRRTKVYFIAAAAVFSTVSALIPVLVKESDIAEWLFEIILFVSTSISVYFLLSPIKKRTFFLYGILYCATCDYLVAIISSVAGQLNKMVSSFIYMIIYLLVIAAVLIYRIRNKVRVQPGLLETLSPAVYIIFFIADLAVCYEVDMVRDSSYYAEVSGFLKLMSTALIVLCISYIIYKFLDSANKQKIAEAQLETEIKHYEEMMDKNREIRSFRHDYKNNLSSLSILIDSQRYQEARNYISEINDGLEATRNNFATGNYFADAILSEKAEKAKTQWISIEFDGTLPESGISNYDMCTVLTNALDNAVRGCAGCEPCAVKINGIEKNNVLKIIIKNPVVKNVEIKNNSIKTTKNDSLNHGIGISNMRRTVKKYDGYISLECDNNEFKTEIGFIIGG